MSNAIFISPNPLKHATPRLRFGGHSLYTPSDYLTLNFAFVQTSFVNIFVMVMYGRLLIIACLRVRHIVYLFFGFLVVFSVKKFGEDEHHSQVRQLVNGYFHSVTIF